MFVNKMILPTLFYPPVLCLVLGVFNVSTAMVGGKLFKHCLRYIGYFSLKNKRETKKKQPKIFLKEQNRYEVKKFKNVRVANVFQL